MPVKNYTFTAGEKKSFGPGNVLRLITTAAEVTVRFFRSGTELMDEAAEGVEAGYSGSPEKRDPNGYAFDSATVESATAQTVKVLTSRGSTDYDRSVGAVEATAVPASQIITAPDNSIAALTTVRVVVGNADNMSVHIANLSGNAAEIRVGDSVTGAARGQPCRPSETVSLETNADVYVFNSHTAAQSVTITILRR